jgi:hypothetical protein
MDYTDQTVRMYDIEPYDDDDRRRNTDSDYNID